MIILSLLTFRKGITMLLDNSTLNSLGFKKASIYNSHYCDKPYAREDAETSGICKACHQWSAYIDSDGYCHERTCRHIRASIMLDRLNKSKTTIKASDIAKYGKRSKNNF